MAIGLASDKVKMYALTNEGSWVDRSKHISPRLSDAWLLNSVDDALVVAAMGEVIWEVELKVKRKIGPAHYRTKAKGE